VAQVGSFLYHYGFFLPPELMQNKRVSFETHMQGDEKAVSIFKEEPDVFDYGNLGKLCVFKETHPEVMKDFIKKFNWKHQLYPHNMQLKKHKHYKLKYRLLSFIEQNILKGNQLAGFKNYELIHPTSSNQ